MDDMKGLIALLGEDNVEMIRKRIAELIVQNIEDQFSEQYLLGDKVDRIEDFVGSVFDECLEESKDRIKSISKKMLEDCFSDMESRIAGGVDGTQAQ